MRDHPPQKMRIAIIGNAASPMVNFRLPLIADIVARGHTVSALAPDFDESLASRVASTGARPVDYVLARTGLNPFSDFLDMLALRRVLKSVAPELVLAFGIKPVIYAILVARWLGVKHRYALITGLGYAFTQGATDSRKRRLVGAFARVLYRFSLRFAHRVFVQNPDDRDDLVAMRIAPAEKIIVVNGTGVDLTDWRPAPPILGPVTFTLAARLLADKGIREFVAAARIVKARHPSARFVLLGGSDSNPQAIGKKEVSDWVSEGIIEWPGHVDMRDWLARTSVFVLPSYREGVPRSTQEAMAMARPIITTDAPGCRETVIEGENGYLVPVRDPEALAEAMMRFINQPSLISSMGEASRRLAEQRFDVSAINRGMIAEMGL